MYIDYEHFFRRQKINREGCRAVRPQNIGSSDFFGQNAQHSELEETYDAKQGLKQSVGGGAVVRHKRERQG